MLASRPTKRKSEIFSENDTGADSRELRFIAELGRSLHFIYHPKKVANRVAEALRRETNAEICVLAVESESIGFVCSGFDFSGCELEDCLDRQRFHRRLEFLPPQIAVRIEDREEFLLRDPKHNFEYLSPLHIGGEVKGAIIFGFADKSDCTEQIYRLIDAATQMAAMSVNLSAHYETAIHNSINQTKEQHQKFTETVLDALPVSLYVIDRNYRIVTWNRHREIGLQGMPRDEVIGRNVFEVLTKQPHQELKKEFERAFKTGKIERIEQRTIDESGTTKHWLVSKIPMNETSGNEVSHVITVGEDITMRVEAIQAVGRAEKLAAVGRLAAGVVHEINNPLATISACAESLENRASEGAFDDSPEADDLRDYLALIRSETFRCKTITNGLLDFSRVRTGNFASLDVTQVINSSARLLAHQNRGANIDIKVETEENLPLIAADEGQIQQAVIALATNAIDAMPYGGLLTLRTCVRNNRVIVEVQDTGHGIAAEDLPKIFEPFFTTKEVGKGTGLGLAVCYGIVTEHGGRLSVRSEVDKGTIFTITLPLERKNTSVR